MQNAPPKSLRITQGQGSRVWSIVCWSGASGLRNRRARMQFVYRASERSTALAIILAPIIKAVLSKPYCRSCVFGTVRR